MIPILYPANETLFIANGLGRLTDAISCKVTEQRNDEYELEMQYPVSGIHFDLIEEGKIIYAKASEKADAQPFVIYHISRPHKQVVTINAEHVSYRLTKEVVKPFTASDIGEALTTLKTNAIDCPFTFYTDKETEAAFKLDHPETIRRVLGGMEGSVLDVYGGEFEWDKWNIKVLANRGVDNGVTLRYGKNITDLTDDTDTSKVYTACVPYFNNGETVKYITSDPVVKTPYYDDYPYGLTVSLDCTQLLHSDNPEYVPTDQELRNCALNYMTVNNSHIARESIKVSFVPLYQTEEYKAIAPLERVYLCDWVTVIYEALGINVKMKVTETVYNTLLERYDSITLGDSTRTLAKSVNDTISEQINTSESSIRASLDLMREKFFGAHDSFKYEETDADGNVIATYYMDTNDISTAQNVMRIDSAGIYFSQTGVTGTFTSAWAIDGTFNANFIQAGTMSANHIKGGTLTLGGANNVNGTIRMLNASGTQIGTWTNTGISVTKGGVNLTAPTYDDNTQFSVSYGSNYKIGVQPNQITFKSPNVDSTLSGAGLSIHNGSARGLFSATEIYTTNTSGQTMFDVDSAGKVTAKSFNTTGSMTCTDLWATTVHYNNLAPISREERKKGIKPMKLEALDLVKKTPLYSFKYRKAKDDNLKYGVVIGEKYDTPAEILYFDEDGVPQGVDLLNYISVLWKAVQELSAKVDDLENKK